MGKTARKSVFALSRDYVIREDDYFIFISPTSNPQVMPRKEIADTELAGVPQDGRAPHRGAPSLSTRGISRS